MTRPIADLWATYAERALSADAGEAQKIESKRCFYADAPRMFQKLIDLSDLEDVAEDLRKNVDVDASEFCDEVKRGEA